MRFYRTLCLTLLMLTLVGALAQAQSPSRAIRIVADVNLDGRDGRRIQAGQCTSIQCKDCVRLLMATCM